uniref:Phosphatidylinositol-glycan biosynthesis class X protein n=1 Tax=Elaeophora elaphi TaxID=1147741 RepID=A0A0R3RUU2_9BILA
MIICIFLCAVLGLVLCQRCDWIDAITIRKADLTIPAGAYVDLDSMKEYPTYIFATASFDVEASREKSKNTPLYVCSKRGLRKNFVYKEHIELPIHLRYHAATGKDAVVIVPAPQLLLRCSGNSSFLTGHCKKYLIRASCDCSNKSQCEWLMIPLLEYNEVQFKIPTGSAFSLKLVSFITAFVVICCAITIATAAMKKIPKVKVK